MNAHARLILLTLCLVACVSDKPYDSEPVQIMGRPGAMYIRGDARETIECSSGRVPRQCGPVEISGLPGQPYFDCSDAQFKCLFNGDVLAIPKTGGLTMGQKYSSFGANLTVERCFLNLASCEMAMVKSECADPQTCGCRSGRTTMFYFSRERGITAFYTISEPPSDMGEPPSGVDPKMLTDAIPLLTYILVAEKGFLRAPLSLPRATSGTNCRS
jgi:hypothetical protein